MYGDFSRNSHDPRNHYRRVLMQQGRPLTDADWNEQASLINDSQWQLIRSLLRKSHGTFDGGFFPKLLTSNSTVCITLNEGTYWVEGLCCEVDSTNQQGLLKDSDQNLLFLEAWEHTISPSADPQILEPALNHHDTSWRSETAWRLATMKSEGDLNPNDPYAGTGIGHFTQRILSLGRKPSPHVVPNHACETSSVQGDPLGESLYRIEVHHSGRPFNLDATFPFDPKDVATFKWSRVNASEVYAINDPGSGTVLSLDRARFSSRRPIRENDKLELRDERGRSVNRNNRLVRVKIPGEAISLAEAFVIQPNEQAIDRTSLVVSNLLSSNSGSDSKPSYHVQVWHHEGTELPAVASQAAQTIKTNAENNIRSLWHGAVVALTNDGPDKSKSLIELEHGLQIQFENTFYLEGDYWLIRTSPNCQNGFCLPNTAKSDKLFRLQRTGGHHIVALGLLEQPQQGSWQLKNNCWNGRCTLPDPFPELSQSALVQWPTAFWRSIFREPLEEDPRPAPCSLPTQPATDPATASRQPSGAPLLDGEARHAVNSGSDCGCSTSAASRPAMLSLPGQQALRKVVASPLDLARHLPARWLNYMPRSASYRKFRAPLLLLDILKPTFDQYFAEYQRCARPKDDERELAREDAARDYELAQGCRKMLVEGDVHSLFA